MRAELIQRYRGRWVALDDTGEVVADADELGQLLDHLESAGVHANTAQRLPAIDDPLFLGLR